MAKLHSASPREITSPFTREIISELHSKACNWASEASPTLGCSNEISREWASKASPTLGCSIEISRDIYIYK